MTKDDGSAEETLAVVLDRAIRRREVTLTWLSSRLADLGNPASVATLSYWRSGQRAPQGQVSTDVLGCLEELLHLSAGTLVDLVPSRPKPGPDRKSGVAMLLGRDAERVREQFEEAGFPDPFPVTRTVSICHLDISERLIRSWRVTSIVEARIDGIRALPWYWCCDPGIKEPPVVKEIIGGEVGRSSFDETTGLLVIEVVLPYVYDRGETSTLEMTLADPAGNIDADVVGTVVERRVSESAITVRFDPQELPEHCWRFERTDSGEQRTEVFPVGNTLHTVVRSFGPGTFGFEFDWPDDA